MHHLPYPTLTECSKQQRRQRLNTVKEKATNKDFANQRKQL